VLLLGSFPSVKSRETGFYYGHPQNRFWKLIATLTKTEPVPPGREDKRRMLLKNGIALWDVVQSCEIEGSSDLRIRQVEPADLSLILKKAPIGRIFANGDRAYQLCRKYSGLSVERLPSTSPANASCGFEELLRAWSALTAHLARQVF